MQSEQSSQSKGFIQRGFSSFKAYFAELPNPGTVENLHKEVRNVATVNYIFEGGKADVSKGLSPSFQVSHSLQLGTMMTPASYHFGAAFMGKNSLLHGMIDHQGNLQGKFFYNLTEKLTAKLQSQISSKPGMSMIHFEGDYLGKHYSLNAKAINPGLLDLSGIFVGSYLQSVTKRLSIGAELVQQNAGPDMSGSALTFIGKLTGSNWIATATLQQMAALQTSYWHKVSESVELGTEMQLLVTPQKKESISTIAAKFEYRQSRIRAQVDSHGKVAMVLEEKLFPGFSFLISGEIDHVKSASRFGVGVNLES